MRTPIQLAIAGAGLIGKRHIVSIAHCSNVELTAIVDPNEMARLHAEERGIPWYKSLSELFESQVPDGIILSTPNQVHLENGLECVAAKCPMLVEKPLASSADEALVLVNAARKAGVPILVGHHRRHNPMIQKAREVIADGRLGQLRTVHANCWLFKPNEFFDEAPWRKEHGAGLISVNLVHDIDLIRYLCGDIVSVQAQAAPSIRGYENEDVAVAALRFKSGALGTLNASDMVVAPWSWELTARENPAYPATAQSCYLLGGSHGSLSLPDLTLWENNGDRSWWQPISTTTFPYPFSDPLTKQIIHFAAVISRVEEPLISGEEGLKTLQVIEAIQNSAKSGETIQLAS
ncbi:MAG: Gfo/Idh/MocA family oxidoreductase [SAR324 cluster bacterium]|nr:Gfo/Idh/MocA family oxidoreductase [SAR324 cluster bacterium]